MMDIQDLIEFCEKNMAQKGQLRTSAAALGDVKRVAELEAEMAETQRTLNTLRALP
jgi:hypothetical protein